MTAGFALILTVVWKIEPKSWLLFNRAFYYSDFKRAHLLVELFTTPVPGGRLTFNQQQSFLPVAYSWVWGGNPRGDIFCTLEMKWILTQSIFQEYTSTFYVCAFFSLPPSPLIVFTLFASSAPSVFPSSTWGNEQSHNFLITVPPPPWRMLPLLTDSSKPHFGDTKYHFCCSFALAL